MRVPLFVAALAALPLCASAAEPVVWQADLNHCRAQFTVSHMIVSKVWGHIPIAKISLLVNPGTVVPQRIDAVLDVAHEDTDNHMRDQDLRSPTYFDVAAYPTMTFRSTSVIAKDASDFVVNGDLTIKNVTKPVTFPVQVVGIIPDRGGWRVGYSGDLQIDRRDWGIVDNSLSAAGVLLVGYKVDIGLTVEALGKDPALHATTQ